MRAAAGRGLIHMCVLVAMLAVGGCALESRYYLNEVSKFETPPEARDVYFRDRTGYQLHGWFIPARSLAEGRVDVAPCLIVCHGQQRTIDYYAPRMLPVPEVADVSLFLFSYRGYGRSEPCRSLTRRATLEDAEAALAAVLDMPGVDPAHIGVLGYSLGGPPALALASRHEEIAFALVGGTYSTAARALSDHGRAWAYPLIGPDLDPEASARRLRGIPLLVFHAEQDSVVPLYHALRIAAAAMESRSPTSFVVVEGLDHLDLLEHESRLRPSIIQFLLQCAHPPTTQEDVAL